MIQPLHPFLLDYVIMKWSLRSYKNIIMNIFLRSSKHSSMSGRTILFPSLISFLIWFFKIFICVFWIYLSFMALLNLTYKMTYPSLFLWIRLSRYSKIMFLGTLAEYVNKRSQNCHKCVFLTNVCIWKEKINKIFHFILKNILQFVRFSQFLG